MDRNYYTDEFEQLLKEKSDEFRMYPSKRVWHSIYNDLHPGRKWPSAAVSMLLIITLLLIGYLNSTNHTRTLSDNGVSASNDVKVSDVSLTANLQHGTSVENSITRSDLNHTFLQEPVSPFTLADNNRIPLNGIIQAGDHSLDVKGSKNNSPENKKWNGQSNGTSLIDDAPSDQTDKEGTGNIIESVARYISSNRLLDDVTDFNKKRVTAIPEKYDDDATNGNDLTTMNKPDFKNTITQVPVVKMTDVIDSRKTANNTAALTTAAAGNNFTQEDKAWMEAYALHNKPGRNAWKDRVTMEFYATPGIGYRSQTSNVKNEAQLNTLISGNQTIDKTINQKPALGLEAGFGLIYHLGKNILLKGGTQLNYTNYIVNADQTNHPILTTLLMNDPVTGNTFISARTSTYSNSSGLQPVSLHNKTYQLSVPVGVAVKLAGNSKKMAWYVGASIQPTFVIGGTANLASGDYKSYVSDPSLIRRWNMNSGFETYINYQIGGYTLQVGPQFRYQLFSTYNKKYAFNENLYNAGLKIGLVKGF